MSGILPGAAILGQNMVAKALKKHYTGFESCSEVVPALKNQYRTGVICVTDQELLQVYVDFVPFLAEVCGPGCEIVIHDVTTPEHSIIAISNGVSGRQLGGPMTDLALELQEKESYTHDSYLTNYTGLSKNGEFLSSTYYIKNENRLIGLLCINKDLSLAKEAGFALQALLEQFNLSAPAQSEYAEHLDNPVADLMHTRIAEIIAQSGVSPVKMTRQEKIRTVHRLNESGILMMKGAVAEIAAQLLVSVPTIYRYLNKPEE